MDTDPTLRLRTSPSNQSPSVTSQSTNKKLPSSKNAQVPLSRPNRESLNIVDIFRFIAGAALVSTLGSYLVTSGESLIWGLRRPSWLSIRGLKSTLHGPIELTNAQLAAYDGSKPSQPIYLALNRTIHDVSASPHIYGPGGMYSTLAAKDASRSFITTCFSPEHDLVPYFGGVEEMFVPLWLSERASQEELDGIAAGEEVMGGVGVRGLIEMVQKRIGRRRVKELRAAAYDRGREMVREKVKTWEEMFERKGYPVVGRVVGVDEESKGMWEGLEFCEEARKQRPNLAQSLAEAVDELGKDAKLDLGKVVKQGGKGLDKVEKATKGEEGKKEGESKSEHVTGKQKQRLKAQANANID